MPPKVEFTGDPKQLVAALDSLETKYKKLEERMGGVTKASKDGHKEIKAHLLEQVDAIKHMAAGYITADKAVGHIAETFQRIRERAKDAAGSVAEMNQEMSKLIAMSGNAKLAPQIEADLASIKGMTKGDKAAAYQGAWSGASDRGKDFQMGLVMATKPLAPFVGGQATGEINQFAGDLAGLDKDMTPEQAANLAQYMSGLLGNNKSELVSHRRSSAMHRLVSSGAMRPIEALGLETAGIMDAKTPGLAEKVAEAADKTWEKPTSRPRTALEREEFAGQRKLAVLSSARERMDLIMSDEQAGRAATGDDYDAFRRMQVSAASRTAEIQKNYPNAIPQLAMDMSKSRGGREQLVAYQGQLQREQTDEQLAVAQAPRGRAETQYEDFMDKQGGNQVWMRPLGWLGQASAYVQGLRNPEAYALEAMPGGGENYKTFSSGERQISGKEIPDLLREISAKLDKNAGEAKSDRRTTATPTNPNQR